MEQYLVCGCIPGICSCPEACFLWKQAEEVFEIYQEIMAQYEWHLKSNSHQLSLFEPILELKK